MNTCPDGVTCKLELNGISKGFDGARVLGDVSLQVREGEFISLMGLSGSGKSTLFNLIAGLMVPDNGRVRVDGNDFTGRTGRVSYMHQKDLLLPWKRVLDNVALPRVVRGDSWTKAREAALQYFPVFGLEGHERKYPHQLSGGMRQRAALMRTWMFSHDILLLDEPFAGLDAITRTRLHEWLLGVLQQLRSTVLLITHDVEEAVLLSDRVAILGGSPAAIVSDIPVNIPRPRSSDMVTGEEFNRIKRQVLEKLKE